MYFVHPDNENICPGAVAAIYPSCWLRQVDVCWTAAGQLRYVLKMLDFAFTRTELISLDFLLLFLLLLLFYVGQLVIKP